MGTIRDSIVMDSVDVELRMDIVEGEHKNWGGKGPLMTRLDFHEEYPGCYERNLPPARREWFDTIEQARERMRAVIPDMMRRYQELCAKYKT